MKKFFTFINKALLNRLIEKRITAKITPHNKPSLKEKFPLKTGDILVMKTGEHYRIEHLNVRGTIFLKSYYLKLCNSNTPYTNRQTTHLAFDTLRELNYYAKKNRKDVSNILCNGPRIKSSTIDTCHQEALSMENSRQWLDRFIQKEK